MSQRPNQFAPENSDRHLVFKFAYTGANLNFQVPYTSFHHKAGLAVLVVLLLLIIVVILIIVLGSNNNNSNTNRNTNNINSNSNNNPPPPLVFKPRCARRWNGFIDKCNFAIRPQSLIIQSLIIQS